MKRAEKFLFEELNRKDADVILKKFIDFEQKIMEWNSKINLVSRKINSIEDQILSSIFFLTKINLANVQYICDIGTGGGFPGIPLKIMYPEVKFTLVDSVRKKTIAVNSVIEHLRLKNIESINSRAETLATNPKYKKKSDIVISKAVSSLKNLYVWSNLLLNKEGYLFCIKGGNIKNELEDLKKSFPELETKSYDFHFDPQYGIEDKKVITIKTIL